MKPEEYEFGEQLSSNSIATVRRCTSAAKQKLIAKIFPKLPACRKVFVKETCLIQKAKSRYVVKHVDSFETLDSYVMITECHGRSLYETVTKGTTFDEEQLKVIAAQLFEAVSELHAAQIFHGDIKLENIVMDDHGALKLIDFGLAEIIPEKSRQVCGSTNYQAPEVLLGRFHSLKADIWALGITIYALAMGGFPFVSDDEYQHINDVVSGRANIDPLRSQYGDSLAAFVKLLLTRDPDTRPSAGQALAHHWLKSGHLIQLCEKRGDETAITTR
jgi:serine/threonine protein kinase